MDAREAPRSGSGRYTSALSINQRGSGLDQPIDLPRFFELRLPRATSSWDAAGQRRERAMRPWRHGAQPTASGMRRQPPSDADPAGRRGKRTARRDRGYARPPAHESGVTQLSNMGADMTFLDQQRWEGKIF